MKKRFYLLLLTPLVLLYGCGGDDAASPAAETIDCQVSEIKLSAPGFQTATINLALNGNKITTVKGAGLDLNFTHAGDSVTYTSSNIKEVAFIEGGRVVRHNFKPANPGTGVRNEERALGTFVYSGNQLTKIVYKNYNFTFGPNNTSVSTTQINTRELVFKYDASGNLTGVEHILIPIVVGSVTTPYKTISLTYGTQLMPKSATGATFPITSEIFESYLLSFITQIKLFKNIPTLFGSVDRSQNPVELSSSNYTTTLDAKGNISKVVEVTNSRTNTYDFTYKCP